MLRRACLAVTGEKADVLAVVSFFGISDEHEHVLGHVEDGTVQPHLIVLGLFDFKAMLFTHRLEGVERYFSYVDATH